MLCSISSSTSSQVVRAYAARYQEENYVVVQDMTFPVLTKLYHIKWLNLDFISQSGVGLDLVDAGISCHFLIVHINFKAAEIIMNFLVQLIHWLASCLFLLEHCVGLINLADVDCGQQTVKVNPKIRAARIAGGREAFHGEFPWMVSLQYNIGDTAHFCAGFLVNRSAVVSAAHCFRGISRDRVNVMIGEHVVGEVESPIDSKALKVASINIHPEYTGFNLKNDIAVVHLQRNVDWNLYVQPACLSNKEQDLESGKVSQVAGWGQIEDTSDTGSTLMTVEMNIVSHSTCENEYEWTPSNTQFCAGHPSKRKGACPGDSGSPLMVKDTGKDALSVVGIHVGGGGCGLNMLPGVYTKVSSYIDWIQTNVA